MKTLKKVDQNQLQRTVEDFYKVRKDLLKSKMSTEELLQNLRPASNEYEKTQDVPFKVGGQGHIYKVACKVDQKHYALKQFQHNFLDRFIDPIHKEEIYREIDILRSLNDPLVVQMFDLVLDSGNLPSVVLELCDGSLQDLIEERKDKGFLE